MRSILEPTLVHNVVMHLVDAVKGHGLLALGVTTTLHMRVKKRYALHIVVLCIYEGPTRVTH